MSYSVLTALTVPSQAENFDPENSSAFTSQSCKGKQPLTYAACSLLVLFPFVPMCSLSLSLSCPPLLALSFSPGYSISSFLQMLHPECKNIPEPNLLPGQLSHGAVGVKDGKVQWISMAFESVSITICPWDTLFL